LTAGPVAGPRRHWWSLAPIPTVGTAISARRGYAEALGVYVAFFGPSIVAAIAALFNFDPPNPESWWITGSDGFQELTQAALAVGLVLALAGRRGRSPAAVGFVGRRSKGGPGPSQAIRMAAWAVLAFLCGSVVTSLLATGGFPFGHASASNTVLELSAAVNAGVVEESVVLAFLVTTLEQAGRPRWEIAVVALLCRAAYHLYYGPGAIGIFLWAGVFLWLFWRFRSIVPMVIAHACWDSLVFLTQVSGAFGALLALGILALFVTAFVLWLVERGSRRPPAPAWAAGPAGWPGAGAGWGGWPMAPPGAPTPPVAPHGPSWRHPGFDGSHWGAPAGDGEEAPGRRSGSPSE
jgi:hypothetical protein